MPVDTCSRAVAGGVIIHKLKHNAPCNFVNSMSICLFEVPRFHASSSFP